MCGGNLPAIDEVPADDDDNLCGDLEVMDLAPPMGRATITPTRCVLRRCLRHTPVASFLLEQLYDVDKEESGVFPGVVAPTAALPASSQDVAVP